MDNFMNTLMARDGLSYDEALELVEETREVCLDAIEAGEDAEEVFRDLTGLEPDYILELF